MSASPATSYGTIKPTRKAPSLQSLPDDDEAFLAEPDGPGALHRGLSSRQVQMIAIGGTIGTGLFLGTGRSLAQGGPASMLICYSIVGFIVYVTLILLGEMATQYPIAGECLIVFPLLCSPRSGPGYHSNSLIKGSQHSCRRQHWSPF
jgi:amino acid permease